MRQYQCSHVGHIYFGPDDHDPGCPVCQQNEAEITKTRAFYDAAPTMAVPPGQGIDNPEKTVGFYSHLETVAEPVVGWLACVAGPDKGKDWRLVEGRNAIGRDNDMPVNLCGDPSVSRQRHAYVSFEPRQQVFSLLPGDSRGLVYCNGTEVVAPVRLEAYDRIELGKSALIFVPLAGASFRWQE